MAYPTRRSIVTTSSGATDTWTVAAKYTLARVIGSGAYGVVLSATDTSTGHGVAIKKIKNFTSDLIDAKRIVREVSIMAHFSAMGGHENIVSLVDVEEPASSSSLDDVYIVSGLMETDLHRVIFSKQTLTEQHVCYFVYQLLRGIKYVHSAGLVHRDIKPSNVLLNANCDLRLADFGLARAFDAGADDAPPDALTEYVVTRWYRAPELLLGARSYGTAVDVWSIGCLLGELLRRRALFPGADYADQLTRIAAVLGSPTDADVAWVRSEKARAFLRRLAGQPPTPWARLLPKASPAALDLLSRMLTWDPARRISVDDALAHPFLESLHCVEDEPTAPARYDGSWERGLRLSADGLKTILYAEIVAFKRAAARRAAASAAATAAPPGAAAAPAPAPTAPAPAAAASGGGGGGGSARGGAAAAASGAGAAGAATGGAGGGAYAGGGSGPAPGSATVVVMSAAYRPQRQPPAAAAAAAAALHPARLPRSGSMRVGPPPPPPPPPPR